MPPRCRHAVDTHIPGHRETSGPTLSNKRGLGAVKTITYTSSNHQYHSCRPRKHRPWEGAQHVQEVEPYEWQRRGAQRHCAYVLNTHPTEQGLQICNTMSWVFEEHKGRITSRPLIGQRDTLIQPPAKALLKTRTHKADNWRLGTLEMAEKLSSPSLFGMFPLSTFSDLSEIFIWQ